MLLKTVAVASILAVLTAGQLELFDHAFGALDAVQAQQASALAQIDAVRAGRPITAAQAQHPTALMRQASDALAKAQADHRAAVAQVQALAGR